MARVPRIQFQIDTNDAIKRRAKAYSQEKDFDTLGEFIHHLLANAGDPKLKKLIQDYLATRRRPGAQPKNK